MNAYAAAAVIILGILSPGFKVIPWLPILRGEDFVLLIIVLFFSPFDARKRPLDPDSKRMRKSFFAMGVLAVISIILSPLLYGTEVIANDWIILLMLFRYYLTYRVGQSILESKGRFLCVMAAMVAFGASAGIGILQNFDLAGINEWLTPLYQGQKDVYVTEGGEIIGRIGGTHGDPRYFGAILVYGAALLVSVILSYPRLKTKIIAGVLVPPLMLSIITTLSRTALSSAAVVLGGAYFVNYRKRLVVGALGLACVLGVALIVFAQYRSMSEGRAEAFTERVMEHDTVSYQSSKFARIRDFMKPFRDMMQNPTILLVGRGPAKGELRTSSHNDYGWYIHRFGILGLIFYLSLLLRGMRFSYRRFTGRLNPMPIDRTIALATFLTVLNWAVFAMAESVWKDGQIMTINMFFLGLAHAGASPAGSDPIHRPI